jgi:hypothetical protein
MNNLKLNRPIPKPLEIVPKSRGLLEIRRIADVVDMPQPVSHKHFKRSGRPSFGIRSIEDNRTKEFDAADPFAKPLD